MARGVSVGGISIAASGASVSFQKNLIAEQAMGLGGEPKIYSSGGVCTGTVTAAFRPTLQPLAATLNTLIASSAGTITNYGSMAISDEKGGISFASHAITSFELSMDAKDYGKCTIGFVGTGVGTTSAPEASGLYDAEIPVFFNTSSTPSGLIGFSVKLEVPIDTDYFVLNNPDLVELLQSGNGTITGTLKFGPTATDITGITSFTATYTGGSVSVTNLALSDASVSGQGRSRFERSVSFRAPCSASVNQAIFT